MAGGGVSLPGAQAYALPSYIWVGPLACSWWSLLGSAGLLVGWGWFLRAGAVALVTILAVPRSTLQHFGEAERQNSTTALPCKTCLARRKQPAEAKPKTAPH